MHQSTPTRHYARLPARPVLEDRRTKTDFRLHTRAIRRQGTERQSDEVLPEVVQETVGDEAAGNRGCSL